MRSVLPAAALVGSLLSIPVSAQTVGRHVFDVVPAQSNFSFSGNVSFSGLNGRIVGNPGTFNVSGQASADLGASQNGIATGQLVEGNGTIITIPTLNAIVPNPLPFLPPLATIQVTGTTVVFYSVNANNTPAPFPVAGNGGFGTNVVGELLTGTAVISGVVNQTISLAGQVTTPQAVSGSLVATSSGVQLSVGINTTFLFSDPASGASGTLTLNGQIVGDDQAFSTADQEISLRRGGSQTMRLSAGTANAGRTYAVLATGSGTTPGLTLSGVTIPINFDGFTTLPTQNTFPYTDSIGVLNPAGLGTCTYTLPPLPVTLNLTLHHAYALLNGTTVIAASNAIPLTIRP